MSPTQAKCQDFRFSFYTLFSLIILLSDVHVLQQQFNSNLEINTYKDEINLVIFFHVHVVCFITLNYANISIMHP